MLPELKWNTASVNARGRLEHQGSSRNGIYQIVCFKFNHLGKQCSYLVGWVASLRLSCSPKISSLPLWWKKVSARVSKEKDTAQKHPTVFCTTEIYTYRQHCINSRMEHATEQQRLQQLCPVLYFTPKICSWSDSRKLHGCTPTESSVLNSARSEISSLTSLLLWLPRASVLCDNLDRKAGALEKLKETSRIASQKHRIIAVWPVTSKVKLPAINRNVCSHSIQRPLGWKGAGELNSPKINTFCCLTNL